MSRILRRPMFRGGRVDGRGTGITSGLGYEKGGRVGYRTGTIVTMPPKTANMIPEGNILQRALSRVKNFASNPNVLTNQAIRTMGPKMSIAAPLAVGAPIGMGIAQLADFFTRSTDTPEAYAFRKEATKANPFLFDETSTDEFIEFSKELAEKDKGEKYGFFPRGGPKKRLEELGLTDQYDASTGERLPEVLEKLTNENTKKNYKDAFEKKDDTEESTEISKADIEKNKELFAELLGGGKARGEDISNMLMSFAGKALKPEATVKGAFGEFFEEEAKRPSSKTKVDQAAAQLAINDYIAGKRSKEATNNLLAKLKVQADLGEADLYENIVKIAGPGSNPTVANLESALKVTKETRGKPVTRIKSTDTIEIEEKDYDSFLIFEDTKRIMYIDQNGNQIPIY
jgi:hypothetical protein